jgi:hypothetical protein
MAAETGHALNRAYLDQAGAPHFNGSPVYDANEVDVSARLNQLGDQAASVTISPAAGAANVSLVTIQCLNAAGAAIAHKEVLDVWLSDAATGAGLTGTTASGAVAAGTAGTDLIVRTAKKETLVNTDATGKYILSITDTGKTGFYVAVQRGSQLTVSAQLVAGNYG